MRSPAFLVLIYQEHTEHCTKLMKKTVLAYQALFTPLCPEGNTCSRFQWRRDSMYSMV